MIFGRMPWAGVCGIDLDVLAFVMLIAVTGFIGCQFVVVDRLLFNAVA